jgi:hypothetical protein
MPLFTTILRTGFLQAYVLLISLCLASRLNAQVCSNPVNVIYGINSAGNVLPITVATGAVGAQINPSYGLVPPLSPNGIGYSPNGKFYYFKRSPSNPPQQFVSMDPGTGTITNLASCPTANDVYVGCLTPNGSGYYCWDSQARLYYYTVSTNTWTLITTDIRDQFGKDVDSIIRAHGSGDAAIDGSGNLIMLPSSATLYGVFKLMAPLPTSAVASVTVKEILPMSPPPAKFVGISLNSTGQIFLSTVNGDNRLFRLENNLTLTFLSTLSSSMDDLTSCNFPFGILAISFSNFSVELKAAGVLLKWEDLESNEVTGYDIQHSVDGVDWKQIGHVMKSDSRRLSFLDEKASVGKNYYRLRVNNISGQESYSESKVISIASPSPISIWPNPVVRTVSIQMIENSKAIIYDQVGRSVKEFFLTPGLNTINVESLTPGFYFIRINSSIRSAFNYQLLKK